MSEMPTTEQIRPLSSEQAAAELARLTAEYQARQTINIPADLPLERYSIEQANAALERRMALPEWVERFNRGDVEARREFAALNTVKAGADRLAPILGRDTTPPPFESIKGGEEATHSQLVNTVETLRAAGLRDEVIRSAVDGQPVTKAERQAVETLRAQKFASAEWRKRLFDNDPDARREFVQVSIVLSAPIRHAA